MTAFVPIDDGYNREGYIAESPGLYEAVTFTYRPMTRREYARCLAEIGAASGRTPAEAADASEVKACEWMARKLLTWDVMTGDPPQKVAINKDNLGQLHPILSARLFDVINGSKPSDRKPIDEEAEVKN